MRKSTKILTLTLLSTIATTIPLAFLVSGCVNNTYNDNSSIVINSQSPSITNINSISNPPTLFVDAKSNNGDLSYTWLLSKDDGLTWQIIEGANNSSYTINVSQLEENNADFTLQYKVEIKLKSNSNVSITSNIYKVNIRPNVLNAINLSQDLLTNISLTSDEDLSLSIAAMSKSNKPLWYQWYLQKDDGVYYKVQNSTSSSYKINNVQYKNIKNLKTWKTYVEVYVEGEENTRLTSNVCSIQITPKIEYKQYEQDLGPLSNELITTRPFDSNGLTTVKYDTEKWLADNSLSILFKSDPNVEYLKNYVKSYLDKYSGDKESSNITDNFTYTLMQYFLTSLNSGAYTVSSSHSGTAWMLDYSIDKNNSNLVNYYLATNIHVLDATYTYEYTMYMNTRPIDVSVNVPIRKDTVKSANIYLTQPQYNETSAKQNMKIPASYPSDPSIIDKYWWKTSITENNMAESLIPIGAFTNMGSPSLSDPYNLQLNYSILVVGVDDTNYSYSFPIDNSRAVGVQSHSTKKSSDFAVVKITEEKNKFSNNLPKLDSSDDRTKYENMFNKVQKIFNVDLQDNNEKSSYISRLNSILTMLTSSTTYDDAKAKKLFMFADYNKDFKNNNTISIGGFPALWEKEGKFTNGYVTFNSNTISYFYNKSYPDRGRSLIEYYYNGNRYVSEYNRGINLLFTNMNLMGGSSGSMCITDEYKIGGIYWGGIYSYPTFEGAMTRIYSHTDPSSMVQIWLKYIEKNDPNSKLLQLFNGLKTKNFFTN